MRSRACLVVGVNLLAIAGPAHAQTHRDSAARTSATSLEFRLRRYDETLADDSLLGRGTGSRGLQSAARFVANEFGRLGLQPFGGHDFIRPYPLARAQVVRDSIAVTFDDQPPIHIGPTLGFMFDHNAPRDLSGDLVLISGRVTDSALAHQTFAGAIAVVIRPSPPGRDPAPFTSLGALMRVNPYAVIFVGNYTDSTMRQFGRQPGAAERMATDPTEMRAPANYSHGLLVMRPEAIAKVLAAHQIDVAALLADTTSPMQVRRLSGTRVRVSLPRTESSRTESPQVVGMIPGSDPKLRDEIVVVSAHLDHLGIGSPVASGDSIYNGADDNAAGVSVLLSVAENLRLPGRGPKRTVLFFASSGEERGLQGSDYFVGMEGPVERIVADVNIDGVGRPRWTDSIAVLGGEWSTLGSAAKHAGVESGAGISPSFGPHAPFSSSDQWSFARRGIPSVQLYSGRLFAYYHTPSDESYVVDFPWLARVARYVQQFVALVANDATKPAWTDPYHAAGKVPW